MTPVLLPSKGTVWDVRVKRRSRFWDHEMPSPACGSKACHRSIDLRKITQSTYDAGKNLPIIVEPQAMFHDMINKLVTTGFSSNEILIPILKQTKNRTLRIATMCSGTESPVLAMDMIQKAIQEYCFANPAMKDKLTKLNIINEEDGGNGLRPKDQLLQVEHIFSCEIEPFKQAYIERYVPIAGGF